MSRNGAPQACASCKQQRRRCDPTCEMAPYFPSTRFREFQLAYKQFGMSNIVKLMENVEPHQKRATAESILLEARIRAQNPGRGCLGIVKELVSRINSCEDELKGVKQMLAVARAESHRNKRLFDPKQFPLSAMFEQHYLEKDATDQKGDEKASEGECYYETALEAALDAKPFDINSLIPLMEANRPIHPDILARIKRNLDKQSERLEKQKGKRPMECDGEEEEDNEENN